MLADYRSIGIISGDRPRAEAAVVTATFNNEHNTQEAELMRGMLATMFEKKGLRQIDRGWRPDNVELTSFNNYPKTEIRLRYPIQDRSAVEAVAKTIDSAFLNMARLGMS